MRHEGKVVVVTGGSMGIGEAIAKVFSDAGASVVVASRDLGRSEAARQRMGRPEHTLAAACDVRRRQDIAALIEATLARFSRIDVWVNNAGFGLMDPIHLMDLAACRDMFETNLFAVVECMQQVVPVMKRQGGGAIINISSVAGSIAVPYMAAYGATKHALNAITRGSRVELMDEGVAVINVCPGYIATDFAANAVKGPNAKRLARAAKVGISAERVAQATLRAYEKRKREVVVPWRDRLFIKLYQFWPQLLENAMKGMLRPADEVIAEAEKARSQS